MKPLYRGSFAKSSQRVVFTKTLWRLHKALSGFGGGFAYLLHEGASTGFAKLLGALGGLCKSEGALEGLHGRFLQFQGIVSYFST